VIFSEIEDAVSGLVGKSVLRSSGTLAGHAAGVPFEDLVHERLVECFEGRAFRHFEFLNLILEKNPMAVTSNKRSELFGPRSLQYLLQRGVKAMEEWSEDNKFRVKQNDTAESVILPSKTLVVKPTEQKPLILVDVKTQDAEKRAQPPNIISAEKVANACRICLENKESFLPFNFVYVGIKWTASGDRLVCDEVSVKSLTRISPRQLYINWAAAQQIQFHPFDVDQTYKKSGIHWANEYIEVFCDQLEGRIVKENEKLLEFKKTLGFI
jgi:Restriction endonuclease HincII